MNRLFGSVALLAVAAAVGGCAVAPAYDYGYAQPYYPDYGYAYGAPYAPVYGTVGIWGGWGGSCCYHGGGGHWRGGDWHGGHGGGWHGGGYGGSRGGSSWSGGGWHGGGRSH
ncbi:hypothetical protein [Burkholderia sp. WSM2230]|uniref:hypothetical protein n=1 Tax=Burkholderia sp. WSM2230 TaxID=944435 RepID=UPI0003F90711|nr:hypothetical protein [Burkholderia sp. WSM2230]